MVKIGPRNPLNRRTRIRTRIRIDTAAEPIRMETVDLGPGGAQCLSPQSLPIGRPFPCRIWVGEGTSDAWVEVVARVVRSEFRQDGFHIGLQFTGLNRTIRETLKKFLDRQERKVEEDPS